MKYISNINTTRTGTRTTIGVRVVGKSHGKKLRPGLRGDKLTRISSSEYKKNCPIWFP